jgi:Uma2 family endonuclease
MIAAATLEIKPLSQIVSDLGNVPLERVHLPQPWREIEEHDWLRLPDRQRYELVDGILVEKPMGFYETRVGFILGIFLEEFARAHALGIVVVEPGSVRVAGHIRLPDVAFFAWGNLPERRVPRVAILDIAPDLAVEVLSPSNTAGEMARKRGEYFRAGTRLVWEIEPELRQIRVYTDVDASATIGIDDTLTGEPVLPGFSLSVRELFERVDGVSQPFTSEEGQP